MPLHLTLGFIGAAFIYIHFLDLHHGNKDHVSTRCCKAFNAFSRIKQYVLAEPLQSGESKGKATAAQGPRSASLGGDLLLTSHIPGLRVVIYGSTRGALSHVLSQISKLLTAPSILSFELHFSALKSFEVTYVFVLQEWRVGQNISTDKSFLAGFFKPPCTSIWCKIC